MIRMTPLLAALVLSTTLAQTAPAAPPTPIAPPAPVTAPSALAPQVHVAIGTFKCKSVNCSVQLGDGISDALATALLDTGKYALYERENVAQLTEENFFSAANPTEGYAGVDVLIFGTITDFQPEGRSGGVCVFGVCVGGKESTIGVDLRVVDARTRRVIAARHVDGKSSSGGVTLNLGFLLPGLSANSSQSGNVQKAISAMLRTAVDQLTVSIPAAYYR